MSSATDMLDVRATDVSITETELIVSLDDGRTLSVPISWYPRLAAGTDEERAQNRLIGGGVGIHWPLLDEDISVESMLAGRKPGESAASLKRWRKQLDRRRREGNHTPWVESRPLPDWWTE